MSRLEHGGISGSARLSSIIYYIYFVFYNIYLFKKTEFFFLIITTNKEAMKILLPILVTQKQAITRLKKTL